MPAPPDVTGLPLSAAQAALQAAGCAHTVVHARARPEGRARYLLGEEPRVLRQRLTDDGLELTVAPPVVRPPDPA